MISLHDEDEGWSILDTRMNVSYLKTKKSSDATKGEQKITLSLDKTGSLKDYILDPRYFTEDKSKNKKFDSTVY